jgi:plastocyanin domain-containing protein
MQLYAVSTGNFWSGALIMGTFALGTAPGLLGVGGLTSILQGSFAKKFFRFTGIVVFALAIVNISNGLNLIGWKIAFSGNSTSNQVADDDPNVKTEGEVQVVRMDQLAGGYRPNNFTIKQGIPVKWVINSKADTCASSISLPKLGIKKQLQPGENIIEFTPKDAGELRFSCLMGMYSGKFIVEGK